MDKLVEIIFAANYCCEWWHFFPGPKALNCQGVRIILRNTSHSAGVFWTGDRPVARTSTWQHKILTRYGHPTPRRDSNPESQEASSRRPTL